LIEEAVMARKPRSRAAARSAKRGANTQSGPQQKPAREQIVASFMDLLGEKRFEEIGYAEIAKAAGISLAELREAFGSKLAILAAHIKEIDRQVLAEHDSEAAAEETPRERLFDVLMRRIELLEPHKAAVRSLISSSRRDLGLAVALNQLAVRSQQWMLTAADVDASGSRGLMRAQGLALLFASVLRTWVHDDDPGHARTMAALDRSLARGQRLSAFVDDLCRIPRCIGRIRRPRRRRPHEGDEETVAA
jgi:AcrR family transcriptional regulator